MSAPAHLCAVLALVLSIGGCAGRSGGAAAPQRAGAAFGGIEAAALPYEIIDVRTGTSVDEPAFWDRLASARAVCVGEEHPNPHHHWMQLHVVRELFKRLPKGTKLALAMEMFQRPFQGVLDDYAARRIDEAQLRTRSGYAERWGYDYTFYGPTIDAAVAAGAQLLAANAPKELTKQVSRHGLESLADADRAQLPELELADPAHRSWFDGLMEDMGGTAVHSQAKAKPDGAQREGQGDAGSPAATDESQHMPSAERIYTVQVIWDETMADTSATWLAAHPGGHLILLAGNGHCHDSAVVGRMKRRGVTEAVSIRAVIDDGEGSVAAALVRPINDYIVVLKMPPGVERKTDNDKAGNSDKE